MGSGLPCSHQIAQWLFCPTVGFAKVMHRWEIKQAIPLYLYYSLELLIF
jgi:hypothetical protein